MNPQAACLHPDGTGTAIWCAGSPDQTQQVATFDSRHPPEDPGHQRVKRLPPQKGDPK